MNTISNSALLVMDMQEGILPNYADAAQVKDNTAKAIQHARSKNIPVIYVVVGFRKELPEMNPNNKMFSALRERIGNADMNTWMKIVPELAPRENETIVVKKRVSAFSGSDLEIILRSQGIKHIILCGVATSGVVLSTTREAADKDYRITILSDCCGDADPEVHRVLTTKIFQRQADVICVSDWINR